MLPRNRPAVFVRGELYDDLDGPWVSLKDDVDGEGGLSGNIHCFLFT